MVIRHYLKPEGTYNLPLGTDVAFLNFQCLSFQVENGNNEIYSNILYTCIVMLIRLTNESKAPSLEREHATKLKFKLTSICILGHVWIFLLLFFASNIARVITTKITGLLTDVCCILFFYKWFLDCLYFFTIILFSWKHILIPIMHNSKDHMKVTMKYSLLRSQAHFRILRNGNQGRSFKK